jgi:hypothetical protein
LHVERHYQETLLKYWTFLILTIFKLFLKLTPGKHYLHPVTPLAEPGGVAQQGCHAGQPRRAGQTWA